MCASMRNSPWIGHHGFRVEQGQKRAELFRAGMARDVNGGDLLVQDLRPGLRELVDGVVHA